MPDLYHVVTYAGPFGYIKPWTAVRDGETFSQTFLSPSTVEGMRQKLGVAAIVRHRLAHRGLSLQQEQVHAAGWTTEGAGKGALLRKTGVLVRWVMLQPLLHLAFATADDAETAAADHLCLCRNEDLVFPVPHGPAGAPLVAVMTPDVFDALDGFELVPGNGPESIPLGANRYDPDAPPARGRVLVVGNASGEEDR